MIIKKKDMCKTNWNRCLEKEYKYQKFESVFRYRSNKTKEDRCN